MSSIQRTIRLIGGPASGRTVVANDNAMHIFIPSIGGGEFRYNVERVYVGEGESIYYGVLANMNIGEALHLMWQKFSCAEEDDRSKQSHSFTTIGNSSSTG